MSIRSQLHVDTCCAVWYHYSTGTWPFLVVGPNGLDLNVLVSYKILLNIWTVLWKFFTLLVGLNRYPCNDIWERSKIRLFPIICNDLLKIILNRKLFEFTPRHLHYCALWLVFITVLARIGVCLPDGCQQEDFITIVDSITSFLMTNSTMKLTTECLDKNPPLSTGAKATVWVIFSHRHKDFSFQISRYKWK